MGKVSSILILLFYAVSIFGYGTLDFFHYVAHKIKNPVHHHHDHGGHHHHNFQDHHAAKLLNQQTTEQRNAQKIVKAFYFLSFLEPVVAMQPQREPIEQSVFGFKQNALKEFSSPPPVPPPDLV